MFLMVLIGTYMESKHWRFGHETGVIILVGIIFSSSLYFAYGEALPIKYSEHFLFDYALPLILFSEGYNMKRRRFFKNINNASLFGILGTAANWAITAGFLMLIFNYDHENETYRSLPLSFYNKETEQR